EIEEKIAAREPANDKLRRALVSGYYKFGFIQLRSADIARARAAFQQGLSLAEKLVAAQPQDVENYLLVATGYARLSDVETLAGNTASALQQARKSLAVWQRGNTELTNERVRQALSEGYERVGNALENIGDLN